MQHGNYDNVLYLATVLLISCIIYFSIKYDLFIVDDISMMPTFEKGDMILARKIKPSKNTIDLVGSIIIFYNPFDNYASSDINSNLEFNL